MISKSLYPPGVGFGSAPPDPHATLCNYAKIGETGRCPGRVLDPSSREGTNLRVVSSSSKRRSNLSEERLERNAAEEEAEISTATSS